MASRRKGKVVEVVRWIARVSSGIAVLLIMLIFFGEGLTGGVEFFIQLSMREATMLVAFIGIWLGLLLGWKWELCGGFLTICGVVAFYLLGYFFSGSFPRGPCFLIFSSPSLLFLYCGLQSRITSEVESVY
jgi:hypothetical protein